MRNVPNIVSSGAITQAEYRALHYWVESKLGKPMWCWKCLRHDTALYQWANKSGRYEKNIFDWVRMCRKCHFKYDGNKLSNWNGDTCKSGHILSGENLYLKPQIKQGITYITRICRSCQKQYMKKYSKKEATNV